MALQQSLAGQVALRVDELHDFVARPDAPGCKSKEPEDRQATKHDKSRKTPINAARWARAAAISQWLSINFGSAATVRKGTRSPSAATSEMPPMAHAIAIRPRPRGSRSDHPQDAC